MGIPLHTKKNPGASPRYTPEDFKFVRLRDSGGVINMATTAREYKYAVDEGRIFEWTRTTIRMQGTGVDIGDFGGITGGLVTGCLLMVHDSNDDILLDPMDTLPILRNGDFADMAGNDVDAQQSQGATLDQFTARWTIAKNRENTAPMTLTAGQHVSFTTRDDLTPGNLHFMTIMLHGVEYEIPT